MGAGIHRQGRRSLLIALLAVSLHTTGLSIHTAMADLVWESHYLDEVAIVGGSTITTTSGVNVTFGRSVFSDNDGGTFDLDPGGNSDYVTFEAGQLGGHHGHAQLSFDNQDNDPSDYVEFSLNFDRAITDLQFSLLDVDGNRNWDDGVEVYYNGGNNVRDNASILAATHPYNIIDEHSYMHGWESIGRNAGNGQTLGNIDFDFGSLAITSLTIRFFSTDDARSNPNAQEIGVSDLTFTEAVPEASSVACMTLFSVLVLLSTAWKRIRCQSTPSARNDNRSEKDPSPQFAVCVRTGDQPATKPPACNPHAAA